MKSACSSSSGGSWCNSCSGVSLLPWRRLKGLRKGQFHICVQASPFTHLYKQERYTEVDLILCQLSPSMDQTMAKV